MTDKTYGSPLGILLHKRELARPDWAVISAHPRGHDGIDARRGNGNTGFMKLEGILVLYCNDLHESVKGKKCFYLFIDRGDNADRLRDYLP